MNGECKGHDAPELLTNLRPTRAAAVIVPSILLTRNPCPPLRNVNASIPMLRAFLPPRQEAKSRNNLVQDKGSGYGIDPSKVNGHNLGGR